MSPQIDEAYVGWLYSLVELPDRESYWSLFRQLFETKFEYFVAFDVNRAIDGKNLRHEFFMRTKYHPSDEWFDIDCSMLEMLIALADRMALQMDIPIEVCFWKMLSNVNLDDESDELYDEVHVDDILETVVNRLYAYDGTGGLFPLRKPKRDQRNVDLLYQMYAYIIEMYK